MPKWTEEQQLAIDKDNSNIIVSAGAGSGKTAVLTARVIRKLKHGVNINDLLILTFTNAAAAEMKDRIRDAIKEDKKLKKQLSLIDGAYITTFDSFSLSLVKKYHYLLSVNKDINIVDSSTIYYEKSRVIDSVFDEMYSSRNEKFYKLIGDFCIKDDSSIRKYILSIDNKLDLLSDKEGYLEKYIFEHYNDEFVNMGIKSFTDLIIADIKRINTLIDDLLIYVDDDYHSKLYSILTPLLTSENYDEIIKNIDIKMPMLPRGSEDKAKEIKEKISKVIKDLSSICIYESYEELKESFLSTKDYVEAIIDIIRIFNERISTFKHDNNIYEFNDISKMAIRVLKENKDVREELKYSLNEIMVDEYQDTSDLQEEFISLIENNNVYMVGDIKQSIYRFRNANPYIFKNKYDSYLNENGGYKIDLNKNFRSREETLHDINIIFNIVMDNRIGGADYKEMHQMIFGNKSYIENGFTNQNNDLEIYNYLYEKGSIYTKDEIECFTVASDIKNKIDSKYKVFDKKLDSLRDVKYSDFVILMDRSTKFDLYKKIFEYLNIPLTKYTDTSITDSNDILIIKNIIGLILKYNKKEFDTEFKYLFASIARSYLFRLSDEEIFDLLDNIFDSSILGIIKEINDMYDYLSIGSLIDTIIEKFSFYEKLITVGNIESSIIRLEYIYNLGKNSELLGYDIEEFYSYLSKIVEDNIDIDVSMSDSSDCSVKIMTIHKSKGLEYPICYYTGLSSSFNIMDTKDKILFDSRYGIITPYIKEGIAKTFYSYLFKDNFIKEEISEKIRLFYVGLTRCREKMIVVAPLEDKTIDYLDDRLNYRSFLDILNSVYKDISPFVTDINIDDLGISKDYDLSKKVDYRNLLNKTNDSIEKVILPSYEKDVIKKRLSKVNNDLINSDLRNKMSFGTEVHSIFEMFDFKRKDLYTVPVKYRKYIEGFLNSGIDFFNGNIYKEYEFVYNDTINDIVHGKIDLMIEYNDCILIIDYKLKDLSEELYIKQLNGYKRFIEEKTNKTVKIYLYSIIDKELKELKGDSYE